MNFHFHLFMATCGPLALLKLLPPERQAGKLSRQRLLNSLQFVYTVELVMTEHICVGFLCINALGSGATTTPPPPQWYPPPMALHPRHSPKPVLLPCCGLGQSGICAAVVSRTRHELQLLDYEGCMAMVMVAAVL